MLRNIACALFFLPAFVLRAQPEPENGKGLLQDYGVGMLDGSCVFGNCKDSPSVFVFSDGTVYTGEFKAGLIHGRGRTQCAGGETLHETWDNGTTCKQGSCKSGEGKMRLADCSSYQGQFLNGRPDGNGMFRFPTGVEFRGRFKDGLYESGGLFSRDGRPTVRYEFQVQKTLVPSSATYADWEDFLTVSNRAPFTIVGNALKLHVDSLRLPPAIQEADISIRGGQRDIVKGSDGSLTHFWALESFTPISGFEKHAQNTRQFDPGRPASPYGSSYALAYYGKSPAEREHAFHVTGKLVRLYVGGIESRMFRHQNAWLAPDNFTDCGPRLGYKARPVMHGGSYYVFSNTPLTRDGNGFFAVVPYFARHDLVTLDTGIELTTDHPNARDQLLEMKRIYGR